MTATGMGQAPCDDGGKGCSTCQETSRPAIALRKNVGQDGADIIDEAQEPDVARPGPSRVDRGEIPLEERRNVGVFRLCQPCPPVGGLAVSVQVDARLHRLGRDPLREGDGGVGVCRLRRNANTGTAKDGVGRGKPLRTTAGRNTASGAGETLRVRSSHNQRGRVSRQTHRRPQASPAPQSGSSPPARMAPDHRARAAPPAHKARWPH